MSEIPVESRILTTPPGGVMTREVGAVTGEVEVWLDPERPGVVRLRYPESDDRYTVVGRAGKRGLEEIVSCLTADPGLDGDGNPAATDLSRDEA